MGAVKKALEYLERLSEARIELGLDRVRRVAEEMGLFKEDLPVVLIGGSNGKGSTAFTLSSLLCAQGLKVGLYTSPHLRNLTERITVDGSQISIEELSEAVCEVKGTVEELSTHLTYFEVLTLAAMRYFLAREVDIALLEVGLGGRLDATNIFSPSLSILTGVSPEHQGYLGNTLEEIAWEKAHILRSGTAACMGPLLNPNIHLNEVLRGWAIESARGLRKAVRDVAPGARVVELSSGLRMGEEVKRPPADVLFKDVREVLFERMGGGRWRFLWEGRWYTSPYLGGALTSSAAMAVAAMNVLSEKLSMDLDPAVIERGLHGLRWEGRGDLRVSGGRRVLLDGAHNLEGAINLTLLLEELDGRFNLIFACLKDKPCTEMLKILKEHVGEIHIVKAPIPRTTLPSDILRDLLSRTGGDISVTAYGRTELKDVLNRTDGDLLIAGSLYVVGEALKLIEEGVVPL